MPRLFIAFRSYTRTESPSREPMIDLSKSPRFLRDAALVKKLNFLEIEWRRACPDVGIEDQLGWAHYWISTNSKGKSYKDMGRFLSNWFKRCQQDHQQMQASAFPVAPRKPTITYKEEIPPEEEIVTPGDFQALKEALRAKKP